MQRRRAGGLASGLGALLLGCSGGTGDKTSTDAGVSAEALGLNEVSIVLPLPQASTLGLMLAPTDVGPQGELFPGWAMPTPALVQSQDRASAIQSLRVVALRIDPCSPFIGATDLSACQRILHVIFQPVSLDGSGQATTSDAAIHAFYRLSEPQFVHYVASVLALQHRAPTGAAPLQVQPSIAAEGLTGAYWQDLRRTVLEVAGAANLDRMTYMALRATTTSTQFGQGWLFSGADFHDGAQHRVVVATTSDSEQHFGNNVAGSTPIQEQSSFKGDVIPQTSFDVALLPIIEDSTQAAQASDASIQSAVDEALTLENPLKTTLDSASCVGCHVATPARVWAQQHRSPTVDSNPLRYTSRFDLTLKGETSTSTNALRGLGYYGARLSISQRTVNDTAADAEFINTHILGGH